MLARFGVFEWSLVASTETSDLIAELRRRGYAVAIVTPDELIETVENLDHPPTEFDTADATS